MKSNIQDFYSNKVLFVTGATGFLGKTLIEKLLRSCDGIKRVYILVRPKKSTTAKDRAMRYISHPIFAFNGLKESGVCLKIEPIFGDILLPGLGISSEDRRKLCQTVNIVIHLAANVKLNAPFRYSVQRNLKPMLPLIELCHQMERLDCLVYASTIALLNGTGSDAEEVRINPKINPKLIIKLCDNSSDEELNQLMVKHFSEYNNTYCISKALAEQLLYEERNRLNIAIVRPSAILAAYNQPMPGWLQGLQISYTGLLIGIGLLQVLPFLVNADQCVIPVDFVVNAIISSAWFVSNKRGFKLEVFHLTTKMGESLPIKDMLTAIKDNSILYPSKRVVRPPEIVFSANDYDFKIKNFWKHWVFAYFVDCLLKLMGRRPKMVSVIQVMNENFVGIQEFVNTSPDFKLNNTFRLIDQMCELDKSLFDFDVRSIDWKVYPRYIWLGIRRNLLKEKDYHLEWAQKNYNSLVKRTRILNSIILFIPTALALVIFTLFY